MVTRMSLVYWFVIPERERNISPAAGIKLEPMCDALIQIIRPGRAPSYIKHNEVTA